MNLTDINYLLLIFAIAFMVYFFVKAWHERFLKVNEDTCSLCGSNKLKRVKRKKLSNSYCCLFKKKYYKAKRMLKHFSSDYNKKLFFVITWKFVSVSPGSKIATLCCNKNIQIRLLQSHEKCLYVPRNLGHKNCSPACFF